uniref:Uncharacterized protein n=1 Tax=Siphoviridae sp. ctLqe90 TaxID=2825456 RepID=A0A8S5Q1Q8_9CAUD|nr:MAG TPA: hypothetical protein [Siphoviridae sp. ctLqe90]
MANNTFFFHNINLLSIYYLRIKLNLPPVILLRISKSIRKNFT